ncbi:MAG TPA: Gfo/Idh/MocA family oxidoreductase [Bryobacteraceae bacterium]|nr:Gfo/Idh/MocA family oxidoreductase [Bryobacteraceae bacterium]
MQSRRNFIGNMATGLAGTLAAPNVLGAQNRVRFGIIGAGARGAELLRDSLACANTECVGVADIYSRRLEEVRAIAPAAHLHAEYRRLLEDPAVDAVFIATPQHLHAEHFIAALDAGKHVYLEKTMAFTVDDAKQMRAAFERAGNRRAVQIGHQFNSSGHAADAARFLQPDLMGKITFIQARMYRNTPAGKPQWARPVYPDMTPESIQWQSFLGSAPEIGFDAHRFVNWRYFWDYSGGSVFENMSHQLAFWYRAMGLRIPRAVTMTGGIYIWKDGREVPDTMNVSMEHDEELLFTWDCGFGNERLGITEDVLGTAGTISRTPQTIRYTPEKKNRPGGNEMNGVTRTDPKAHVANFLDAIRSNRELNCPFDLGYRVSIACRMAVESYRRQRTVRWDPAREEIV